MKTTTAASLLALGSSAQALNVVGFDIAKTSGRSSELQRRNIAARATITESLANNVSAGAYMANVSVGTPGQQVSLILDTGSSDVWMLSSTADICTDSLLEAYYGSCSGGTFNSDDSSSFEDTDEEFLIEYQDESGAYGDYITDDLTIGGSTIKSLQMGLAYNSTVNVGIMGVGYDTNEAAETQYPSIIDELVSQGLINTKAYSLWLNDLDSSTGSILFGGIDTEKYTGNLTALPIQSDEESNSITSFTIAWTSLSVTGQSGSTDTITNSTFAEPVILDSGTTLTYIPDEIAAKLYTELGAQDDTENSGAIFVDCDLRTTATSTTINYGFGGDGGPTIKVPIDELIFDLDFGDASDSEIEDLDLPFENTCALGVYGTSWDGGVNLLGDTFLRSAYVVYDLKNNEIALAQTNFNSTGSNVVEIPADSSGIPYVSGVATGASVTQTATGAGAIGGTATSSSTATSSGNAGAHIVPAFDASAMGVLMWSGLLAAVGASMILV